jgi:hypothetical protein
MGCDASTAVPDCFPHASGCEPEPIQHAANRGSCRTGSESGLIRIHGGIAFAPNGDLFVVEMGVGARPWTTVAEGPDDAFYVIS